MTDGFVRVPTSSGQPFGDLTDFAFVPDSTGKLTRGFISLGRAKAAVKYTDPSGSIRTLATIPNVFSAGDYGLVSLSLSPDYLTTGEVALLATYASPPYPLSRVDIMKVDNPLSPTTFSSCGPSWAASPRATASRRRTRTGPARCCGPPTEPSMRGSGTPPAGRWPTPPPSGPWTPTTRTGRSCTSTSTGGASPTNPYYGKAPAGSWRERVFASGLRNPYRFSADPTPG